MEHAKRMEGRYPNQEDDEYEMRIRVIVRIRPMSKFEASDGSEMDVMQPLEYEDYGRILAHKPKTQLDLTKEIETTSFAFDNVFDEHSNNVLIYERAVQSLIPGVFRGKWASVFAYGQTVSSGLLLCLIHLWCLSNSDCILFFIDFLVHLHTKGKRKDGECCSCVLYLVSSVYSLLSCFSLTTRTFGPTSLLHLPSDCLLVHNDGLQCHWIESR